MEKKEFELKIKREIFATLRPGTDILYIEYVFELIEELEDKAREEELEWVLKNCSGGGNWRRKVNQRLSKLKE